MLLSWWRRSCLDDLGPSAGAAAGPPPLWPFNDLSVFIEPVLGLEAADPVQVVGGESEGEQHGLLHDPHHPKEPTAQVGEGPLERRVRRLDDLPASHADPPGGGPERDGLPPGELLGHGGQDAVAATPGVHVDERHGPGLAHGLGERPASQEPRAEWAAPPGSPVGVRTGVPGEPPLGALVELGLVLQLLHLRGTAGRDRQVPQLKGSKAENS